MFVKSIFAAILGFGRYFSQNIKIATLSNECYLQDLCYLSTMLFIDELN